jgi:predicted dehydrogenase
MPPFRLAVAGLIHDHVWSMLPQFLALEGVEIVGAADPNAPLREKIGKDFGVKALFKTPAELFKSVKADGVLVCDSNAGGVAIVEAAAKAGLPCMVEKPMASTAAGAKRMIAAARKAKVRLMVNWPMAWWPSFPYAIRLVQEGSIGHVFHARIHMAHQGPQEAGCTPYFYNWLYDRKLNGAGALVDYCCYGAAVMGLLWGKPKEVFGIARTLAKKNFPVDDNAMVVGIWKDHTALAQASWTQNPDFHDTLFLGVRGTLETQRGKLFMSATRPEDFSHWGAEDRQNRTEIPVPEPAPGYRNGPEHFVHALRTGEPFLPLCSAETGLLAQEILDAGLKSEQTGRRIKLGR